MKLIEHHRTRLSPSAFRADRHAARYVSVLEAYSSAFDALLGVLNDPQVEQLMIHESRQGDAALRAFVEEFSVAGPLHDAATNEDDGARFRQAVGVAIRLKMDLLGWTTSGRKGPVPGTIFTRAEKYVRPDSPPPRDAARALAALERVASIGSDEERRSTGEWLDRALAATRAEQDRPY